MKATVTNPANGDIDEIAAQELAIYIENSPELYRRQGRPIILNLARKIKRGVYDPALATKLWNYLAESGAKEYNYEHGDRTRSLKMFNKNTRWRTAELIQEYFQDEVDEAAEELKAGRKINPCGGKSKMKKRSRRKNPVEQFKQLTKVDYPKNWLRLTGKFTNEERNFVADLYAHVSTQEEGQYFQGVELNFKDCKKLAKILGKILRYV